MDRYTMFWEGPSPANNARVQSVCSELQQIHSSVKSFNLIKNTIFRICYTKLVIVHKKFLGYLDFEVKGRKYKKNILTQPGNRDIISRI